MARLVHCFQVETEIGILVSVEGGKPEDAEKNLQSKDKYQRQTQPTWDARARNRTRAAVGEDERSHHCATPTPLICESSSKIYC